MVLEVVITVDMSFLLRPRDPSIAQMANDPTLDVRHHDLLVDVIEKVVKVPVVQLQGLVL
jgi:hypothetical protein